VSWLTQPSAHKRIRSQIEGAAVMGLALAKHGQVPFKDGRPQQNNFDGFVVARIDDAPLNVTGRNLFLFIARARQSSTRRLKPSSRGQDVPTGLIEDFVKCRSLQGFFDHRDQSGVAEGFSQPKSFRL
jgi:hypothetical protein